MKLKTLKDISGLTTFQREKLKSEAVKWVKWLNTLQGEGDYTDNELEVAKMQYIDFFNLTEEDLKDEN